MTKKLYFPVVVLLIGLLAGGCVVKSDDDPCEGVTCDGHGTCLDVGGEAECVKYVAGRSWGSGVRDRGLGSYVVASAQGARMPGGAFVLRTLPALGLGARG